jgi:hypothetical protein
MKLRTCLAIGAVTAIAGGTGAFATGTNITFRTPTAFEEVIQGEVGGKPAYEFEGFAGVDLVNLALGTELGTVRTNEVLALEVACGSGSASLVVFDKAGDSNIAVIATSSLITVVQQQDNPASAFPNRERFATEMTVASVGGNSNKLVSGFLDLAGRLYVNPTNGCPRAVLVDTDRKQDKICGDPKAITDKIETIKTKEVGGRAHFHGALVELIAGQTNTVVVPDGAMSIQRELAP